MIVTLTINYRDVFSSNGDHRKSKTNGCSDRNAIFLCDWMDTGWLYSIFCEILALFAGSNSTSWDFLHVIFLVKYTHEYTQIVI